MKLIEEIKNLRKRTGVSIILCKDALYKANGDIEKALQIIYNSEKYKSVQKLSKKTDEGIICLEMSEDKKKGVMIEVNCETDFVSRNKEFLNFAKQITKNILNSKNRSSDISYLLSTELKNKKSIEEYRKELSFKFKENIKFKRASIFQTKKKLGGYIHRNRIGVLVELENSNPYICHDIAMHIAAMNPYVIDINDFPLKVIEEKRKNFFLEINKKEISEKIKEKIVLGKINKFLNQNSLLQQDFIKNPRIKVLDFLGKKNKILRYKRYSLGEDIKNSFIPF